MISKKSRSKTLNCLRSAVLAGGLMFCLAPAVRAESPTAPTASAGNSTTVKIPGTEASFELVSIPAGKFMMGSPAGEKGRNKEEGPQVEVQIDAFRMQTTAVTWDEYNSFLMNYDKMAKAGKPAIPKDKWADAVTYPTPMYELEAGPKLDRMGRPGKFPAVIMSQYAARQYTKWLSKRTGQFYRLPTEAEWEYAARAGTSTAYPWGNDAKAIAEYTYDVDNSNLKDGDPGYHRVGEKKPNAWGLYDMNGNVANWVIDQYDAGWYQKLADKGGTVNWHDAINWPSKQYPRVFRGGAYDMEAEDCRSAARHHSVKDMNVKDPQLPQSPHWLTEGFNLGFRVVQPAQAPSEAEKLKYWDVDDEYTAKVLERDREIREIIQTPASK